MTHNELINELDKLASTLQTEYSIIKHATYKLQKQQEDVHLSWSLAHMQSSMLDFIRDLERHKKYLNVDNGNNECK